MVGKRQSFSFCYSSSYESSINVTALLKVLCLLMTLQLLATNVKAQDSSPQSQQKESREPQTHALPSVTNFEKELMSEDQNKGKLSPTEALSNNEEAFLMQENEANYIIAGKPDTKVQFSFKFKMFKKYNLYLGYTQVMFWELGQKDSNPFSEINYNPELFYQFNHKYPILFDRTRLGYMHISNGEQKEVSRGLDGLFVDFSRKKEFSFGLPELQLRLRYIWGTGGNNDDIRNYYGPVVVKLFFTKLGRKIFKTEQLYVEYYNGGDFAEDFSKSSVRVSFRFKPFALESAPKIFLQYFNGYGENLFSYNQRDESFRIGLSIGGQ